MKCPLENQGEELLLNYVSGALDSLEAALFDQHMLACPACREFAHGQKFVWETLDAFTPAEISADFDRRLYQRIEKGTWWDRVVAAVRSPAFMHRGLPLTATAAVLAIAGFIYERPAAVPEQPHTTALSAEVQTVQPEQVQHALDDIEMLREFNHLMRTEPSESKM